MTVMNKAPIVVKHVLIHQDSTELVQYDFIYKRGRLFVLSLDGTWSYRPPGNVQHSSELPVVPNLYDLDEGSLFQMSLIWDELEIDLEMELVQAVQKYHYSTEVQFERSKRYDITLEY